MKPSEEIYGLLPKKKRVWGVGDKLINQSIDKSAEKLSERRVTVRELREKLLNLTPELVEKHFPKNNCEERGKAIMLHADMLAAITALMEEFWVLRKEVVTAYKNPTK